MNLLNLFRKEQISHNKERSDGESKTPNRERIYGFRAHLLLTDLFLQRFNPRVVFVHGVARKISALLTHQHR